MEQLKRRGKSCLYEVAKVAKRRLSSGLMDQGGGVHVEGVLSLGS